MEIPKGPARFARSLHTCVGRERVERSGSRRSEQLQWQRCRVGVAAPAHGRGRIGDGLLERSGTRCLLRQFEADPGERGRGEDGSRSVARPDLDVETRCVRRLVMLGRWSGSIRLDSAFVPACLAVERKNRPPRTAFGAFRLHRTAPGQRAFSLASPSHGFGPGDRGSSALPRGSSPTSTNCVALGSRSIAPRSQQNAELLFEHRGCSLAVVELASLAMPAFVASTHFSIDCFCFDDFDFSSARSSSVAATAVSSSACAWAASTALATQCAQKAFHSHPFRLRPSVPVSYAA